MGAGDSVSADTLRRAATAIRVDNDAWGLDVTFHAAVADLLEEAANGVEVMAPLDWDYPMGPRDCTGSLRPEFTLALAIARAYLGES